MAISLDIYHLLNQPPTQRDHEWEQAFFHAFLDAKISVINTQPQQGPDGWPYLMVSTSESSQEPAHKVVQWLSDKGIGLALNPQKGVPDYVFTYGMLWNFRERSQFITNTEEVKLGAIEFEKGQKVLAGPPSAEFLPEYVRSILRQFFSDQGVKNIKVLIMSTDQKHFDLCFSLDSLGLPDKSEHRGISEAISWFLPSHYSLVLAKESGLPSFYDL